MLSVIPQYPHEYLGVLTGAVAALPGRSQRLPRDGRTETAAAQQAGLDFLGGLKCPYT